MKDINNRRTVEDSSPVPEQQPTGEEDYSWMQSGTKIMVKMGKEELPFAARVMAEPSFEIGRSWMVKVKWEGWTRMKNGVYEEVECSKCEKIDISEESHRRRLQPKRSVKTPETPESGKNTPEQKEKSLQKLPLQDDGGDQQSIEHITPRKRGRTGNKSLSEEEMLAACAAATVTPELENSEDDCKPPARTTVKFRNNKKRYEDAKQSLCAMPGLNEQEVVQALEKVGPPYGLQTVMHAIEDARTKAYEWTEPQVRPFVPTIGMRVRKVSGGKIYYGTVTGDAELCRVDEDDDNSELVPMWEVTFDDGDLVDDMDWHELFQCRVDRPRKPAPCRGRQLQFLELFSGQGIVSHEFCDRKWRVTSIDSSQWSNATIKEDILTIKPEDLDFVPDCIWASPPCETYSNLSGGVHRSIAKGQLEKSDEARKHNFFFQRMTEIMHWAKEKHPHLIVVIENPVGSLKSMPLMKEFTRTFRLYCTTVHYCAFGRDDKKPTNIWTNDFGLKSSLSEFTCDNKCPYSGGTHPINVRQHGYMYDAAAIPQPLAEEVAEYVHSKFYLDRIRYKPAAAGG